ncbi:MAG: prephenate dehydrogenase/arogenate dehydrogenase family protein [Gammaproteobacteria bacterium]|nr:prephenate dehydrogenase/arogenate dehydrogenase family protein [Gammaproteobacteria bacterium]MCY4217820.1 prephenate dehydrogenase/arogenate dehydrogenase family protein [Gammaproteobacteria bacterium]
MNSSSPLIRKLIIVGVGLIGGSLALALRRVGAVEEIVGIGRSEFNLETALKVGAIDQVASRLIDVVHDADIVVLATPVNSINQYLAELSVKLPKGIVITDVGSVKQEIMLTAKKCLKEQYRNFVPGHPIAGRESSGINAANSRLFENHNVVLTPDENTDPHAIALIKNMWLKAGASIILMDRKEHDAVLSITSHLPHILAYAMMNYLADDINAGRCYQMAAGGFYDFTRTASSDPEMWRDISFMNKDCLLEDIRRFQNRLEDIANLIQNDEDAKLRQLFQDARQARSLVTERRNSC